MRQNIESTIPEEGVKNYLQEYFQAKMIDEEGFDASRIHVYASAEDAAQGMNPVDDHDLRVMVRSGQNFFVKYDGKDEVVPFTARGPILYSGQDMVDLVTDEIQKMPKHVYDEPASEGPGFWSTLMFRFFNYKTEAYRAYEEREFDRRMYKQEIDLRNVRSMASNTDENGLDLEIAEVRKNKAPQNQQAEKSVKKAQAEQAPADIDISENLKIGDAASKDPKPHEAAATIASTMADGYLKKTPRYGAITTYLSNDLNKNVLESVKKLIGADEQNYEAAKQELQDAMDNSYFQKPKDLTMEEMLRFIKNQPDIKYAADLKQASSAISKAETEGLYIITEKEYNEYFKEQDAASWRKLDNGTYVDTVHEELLASIRKADPGKKSSSTAAPDNGVHLTEEEKAEIHEEVEYDRLHNELLSKLWADRRAKIEQDKAFIVNTIVDGFVKPGQEAEREALTRQVEASTTLNRMLHETENSLNMTLKLAQNSPKVLQDTFVEKLKENTGDKIGNVAEQSKNTAKKVAEDKKVVEDKKVEIKPMTMNKK